VVEKVTPRHHRRQTFESREIVGTKDDFNQAREQTRAPAWQIMEVQPVRLLLFQMDANKIARECHVLASQPEKLSGRGGLIRHIRQMVRFGAFALLAGCFFLAPTRARADDPPPPSSILPASSLPPSYSATRGHWDFGAQVGYSMEYGFDQHEVSHIQMLIAQPQIGFIVRDFQSSAVRRFEIIDEGILGGTVHPHVAYLAGSALLFRLEGREHGRWVPFFDAGAGAQRTPLADHVHEVNGATQFTPQGGFGVEYFIAPQRALVFEWRTVHMSNASLVPPNMGFNSSMITVGFRWFRKPR
jgi:hypothetical protein